ncbi:MAG: hypothetical protein AB2A00_05335 [Myxococcota bacterium]
MRRAVWTPGVLAAQVCLLGCPDAGESRLQDLTFLVEAEPASVDFGAVITGARAARVVTLRNRGNTTIRITNVIIDGDLAFTAQVPEQRTLSAGRSLRVDLRFLPDETRTCTGTLTLYTDAPEAEPVHIALHGVGAPLPTCDDDNPCTLDRWDVTAESCAHTPVPTACNDGNACTTDDTCADGVCRGFPIACRDDVACTVDACDPLTGCAFIPVAESCDDGDPCTADLCDPLTGCGHAPAPDGTACGAAGACTTMHLCFGGACQPVPVPDGMPCDDGNACTTGDACRGGVCAGFGCGAALVEGTAAEATAVLVDEAAVYWAAGALEQGRILRAFKEGGSALTLAAGTTVKRMLADETHLYWLDQQHHAVIRMPKLGGGQQVLTTHLEDGVSAIALDEDSVYWPVPSTGTIWRTPRTGGPSPLVCAGAGSAVAMAVDSTHLYWADGLGGQILRVPKHGGEPVVLFREQGSTPVALAVEDTDLAWITANDDGTRTVFLGSTAGGGALALHRGAEAFSQVLLQGQHVYAGAVTPGGPIHRFTRERGTHSVMVTRFDAGPRPFTVDETGVYHVEDGVVLRTALQDDIPVLGSRLGAMSFAAMNAQHIYWTVRAWQEGGIMRIPRGGGAAVTVIPETRYVMGLAVDDTRLYWGVYTQPGTDHGAIWRSSLDGNDAAVLLDTPGHPKRLYATPTDLVWFSEGNDGGDAGCFNRARKSGEDWTSDADTLNVGSIARHEDALFWVGSAGEDPGGSAILTADADQGLIWPVVPYQVGQWLSSVGADSTYVYFFRGPCRLWRIRRDGGEPEVFVDFHGRPDTAYHFCGITSVDDDDVFFQVLQYNSDYSVRFTSLMRVAKATGRAVEVASFPGRWRELLGDGSGLTTIDMDAGEIHFLRRGLGTPRTVTVSSVLPVAMAASGGSVFWVNRAPDGLHSILRMDVGEERPVVVASDLRRPSSLVADGGVVSWTDEAEGTVLATSVQGGPVVVLARGQRQPYGLTWDGEFLYWATRTDDGSVTTATIRKVPRHGGTVVDVVSGLPWVGDLQVVEGDVYWLSADHAVRSNAALPSFPALATMVRSFAVDAQALYFAADARIQRRERETGNLSVLSSIPVEVTGPLLVDESHVYWVDGALGLVRLRKDVPGTLPQRLAEVDPARVTTLALLPNAVVWGEEGVIRVVPK